MNKEGKQNAMGVTTPELAKAHTISVLTFLASMLVFFLSQYRG